MDKTQIGILFCNLSVFLLLQISIISIGNRPYSMHYKSHLLLRRRGLCKLIYFKPKHFHRYSLWEVLSFYLSYLFLIIGTILFILCFDFKDLEKYIGIYILIAMGISLLGNCFKILYIDITARKESKCLVSSINDEANEEKAELIVEHQSDIKKNSFQTKLIKSMLDYSQTVRFNLDTIYDKKLSKIAKSNGEKIEALDLLFIGYYRTYKTLVIENGKIEKRM